MNDLIYKIVLGQKGKPELGFAGIISEISVYRFPPVIRTDNGINVIKVSFR